MRSMTTYSGSESSSSKHPQDWGRAMSAAMTSLVAQARSEGHPVEQENLYGQDLHLLITETGDGVTITLSWSPEAPTDRIEG
jgi:hypothetical protein